MNFTIDLIFLSALANPAPTPGGGSAAAYAGAMSAALVAMVAQSTTGKKGYADVQPRMRQIAEEAETCLTELEQAVVQDAAAFDALLAAMRIPKESGHIDVLERAALHVTEVPLKTSETALQVLTLAVEVADKGNINAISDACAGASLANSAIFVSCLNVKVNAKSLVNRDAASNFLKQIEKIEIRAGDLMMQLNHIIQERGGID